ncbi:modulator of smoothened protein isoform 2-T2 [Molossus nigricans]
MPKVTNDESNVIITGTKAWPAGRDPRPGEVGEEAGTGARQDRSPGDAAGSTSRLRFRVRGRRAEHFRGGRRIRLCGPRRGCWSRARGRRERRGAEGARGGGAGTPGPGGGLWGARRCLFLAADIFAIASIANPDWINTGESAGALTVGLVRQCQTIHGRDRTCIPPRLPPEWVTTLFFIIMGIISLTVTCGLLVASHWRREATKYARWIAFTGKTETSL